MADIKKKTSNKSKKQVEKAQPAVDFDQEYMDNDEGDD